MARRTGMLMITELKSNVESVASLVWEEQKSEVRRVVRRAANRLYVMLVMAVAFTLFGVTALVGHHHTSIGFLGGIIFGLAAFYINHYMRRSVVYSLAAEKYTLFPIANSPDPKLYSDAILNRSGRIAAHILIGSKSNPSAIERKLFADVKALEVIGVKAEIGERSEQVELSIPAALNALKVQQHFKFSARLMNCAAKIVASGHPRLIINIDTLDVGGKCKALIEGIRDVCEKVAAALNPDFKLIVDVGTVMADWLASIGFVRVQGAGPAIGTFVGNERSSGRPYSTTPPSPTTAHVQRH